MGAPLGALGRIGKCDPDAGALAKRGFHSHIPVMQMRQRADEREPKACSFFRSCILAFHLLERLADAMEGLR